MSKQLSTDTVLTRGVAQVLPDTDSLSSLMEKRTIRVYLGIDPTGFHLTLGHSVVLRKLQQFADLGHEVILLIGNGTVRIGDPTGKDSTRPVLTDAQIEDNFKDWKKQASKVLDFDKITIKHNGDWLDKLSFADIVKLMAKTTVQQLMERDMFQKRVEEGKPIHGHEIIYPLLQGYDSVAMDVDLEIGGTDQTFNMMMGRTLQKAYNNKEKWVLATPIINGTDGRKMSKSYGNYIALTEDHINMYGKLMSTADSEIITYFEVLTDIPMEEIEQMKEAIDEGENPMEYKKSLAFEITRMYHDERLAQEAQDHFQKTVQNKEIPDDLEEITVDASSIKLLDLVKLCDRQSSNSQLRRVIEQGGVQLDGEKIQDPYIELNLTTGQVVKFGKRNYYKIKL
ncbi:MAG: tyrosine--tRNA ligase [Candidatus Pacebacteria bacterium]|nr:tyrosine--tRNA ligase [Candidatus Paceibacterota bacterium]